MATFVSDTFTDTSGTALASHTGETGATWAVNSAVGGGASDNFVISDANRCRRNNQTGWAAFYASGSPANADYEVQGTVRFLTDADGTMGVSGRSATAANTMYFAEYNRFSTDAEHRLMKVVAGSYTELGSYAETLTAGEERVLKLSMDGDQISVYVAATLRVGPITDTAITSAGLAGVVGYLPSDNSTGTHLDTYSATDIAAGTTDGVASGAATVTPTAVGASTAAAVASAAGAVTSTGIAGASQGVASSTGTITAAAVGSSIAAAVASAAGTATSAVVGTTVAGNTITSTELGAAGRYIELLGDVLDDLGDFTVLVYTRPTGASENNAGYWYSKVPTSSVSGPRVISSHNSGAPRVTAGLHSTGTANNPGATGANDTLAYSTWQHIAWTSDGTLSGTGQKIKIATTGTFSEISYAAQTDGTTALASDAANVAYLMNRAGLDRAVVGDVAYVAVWNGVVSDPNLETAKDNGPLDVETNLLFVFANQQIYDPNASGVTINARSTHVDGALPPNLSLGGVASTMEAVASASAAATSAAVGASTAAAVASAAGVVSASASSADNTEGAGTAAIAVAASGVGASTAEAVASAAGTITAAAVAGMVIDDDFERSSVNLSGSFVTGTGDDAVISIKPRVQVNEVVLNETRWQVPAARITGVNGFRPTFEFLDYTDGGGGGVDGGYWQYPWDTAHRPYYSYDGLTWLPFGANVSTGSEKVTFRHTSAFTGNIVYVSSHRLWTNSQLGQWIADTAAANPTLFQRLPTSVDLADFASTYPTLVGVVPSGAEEYVLGVFDEQTDELGSTIPVQPLYGFKISDSTLTPLDGSEKRAWLDTVGTHAGEDLADYKWMFELEFIMGADAAAENVRAHFDLYCFAMINAPGRAGGGFRGGFVTDGGGKNDANRNFDVEATTLDIVLTPRAAIRANTPSVCQVVTDNHANWGFTRAMYTNGTKGATWLAEINSVLGSAIHDYGASSNGTVTKWGNSELGATFYSTPETGEVTQQTEAQLRTWAEAWPKSISNLLDAGEIPGEYPAVASAAATAAATGVGASVAAAVASAAGTVTASAVGQDAGDSSAAASSASTVAATATGASTAAADADAGATVTASAVGAATAAADATAAAETTASAVGASFAAAAASAAGQVASTADGASTAAAEASAQATVTAAATGAPIAAAAASASVQVTSAAVGQAGAEGEGDAAASCAVTASAVGASTAAAVASAAGQVTSSATSESVATEADASAAATITASAVGASIFAAVASAAGEVESASIASAIAAAVASAGMTVAASAQSSNDPFLIDYNDVDDPEPRRAAARPRTPQRGATPRPDSPGARPRA